ncbi:NrtR-regulated NrtX [Budviciaceae bacterium CWB-B4]|uniref:NrtR-regulated NrtX n=1 Tax=Limnobaculum xujianqingii TaxID=2738837 RepID=A0A9D7ALZ7_9GAMM|nr:SPFH domain-containing protein [Limnobaculum xujianqingii]MBK5075107.1 NrtR-regulated NrtX [Limnobaculum xujianqingii]MBK5178417.1 NrtR-regulated NrtX [Limnobaculum xujianqingii]
MFGLNFIKADSSTHLIQFQKGQVVRQGIGMSFYYSSFTSTLAAVPVSSKELPFVFLLQTSDFQQVTIQGQVTYCISTPEQAAKMLNFTIKSSGRYVSDDPQKLDDRVQRSVQVAVRDRLQQQPLREALVFAPELIQYLKTQLASSEVLEALGVSVLDVAITAISPSPETAKALEAEVREQLLKESDDAIYIRRLSSIEQEKAVKEKELATEVAIQRKKQEIEEAKIEAQRMVLQKKYVLNEEKIKAEIAEEQQRQALVQLTSENERALADVAAYGIEKRMKVYESVGPEILKALAMSSMRPEQLIAQAFENLTQGENKVGNLNISPELLNSLIRQEAS